jgi:hypothetical protein
MASYQKIEMLSGELQDAEYVRHLRTLTHGAGSSNTDVDLYRTRDGREVVCTSPADDSRAIPQVEPDTSPADWLFAD